MEKLADISSFENLCTTPSFYASNVVWNNPYDERQQKIDATLAQWSGKWSDIKKGWQSTKDQRKSYLGMSRSGILRALQMLSSSTIGFDQQQVAQFIQDVVQEFYQENPNGHIAQGEENDRKVTGLITRGGRNDGAAETPVGLMRVVDKRLGAIEKGLASNIRTEHSKFNIITSMNCILDYLSQLRDYHGKIEKWYPSAVARYTDILKKCNEAYKAVS